MFPLSPIEIADACDGRVAKDDPGLRVTRVSTDTRTLAPGCLFVPLRGDLVDAHDHLNEAVQRGAAAILLEEQSFAKLPSGCAAIVVQNTRRALADLAAVNRGRCSALVIAVAGSNGKTTTKNLLASVLGEKFATVASEASFNNDIGVPLTLLRVDQHHQIAVVEAGTNHPGELAPLLRLVQPGLGVLTSLGREHLEFFGDERGVLAEEGWLAESLPASGTLYACVNDEAASELAKRTRARIVRVGWDQGDDWQASKPRVDESGTTFSVRSPRPEWDGEYTIRLLGRHQVTNALLALAAGAELGLDRAQLGRGLAACPRPRLRMELEQLRGISVLADCYNANADSMRAALETLSDLAGGRRRIALLGDMAELGAHARSAHLELGTAAAQAGVSHLLAVGAMAELVGTTAREGGVQDVQVFGDREAAGTALRKLAQPGDVVLIKASRAARLESVIEYLRDMPSG